MIEKNGRTWRSKEFTKDNSASGEPGLAFNKLRNQTGIKHTGKEMWAVNHAFITRILWRLVAVVCYCAYPSTIWRAIAKQAPRDWKRNGRECVAGETRSGVSEGKIGWELKMHFARGPQCGETAAEKRANAAEWCGMRKLITD
ncbi:hypothetical protein CIRG_05617 [Coccidioides immitis RMSCC 2394]|uniref:Uncharacterized protein n=1 Tax=Coccidioides immitis RMSCC 2394 TaxID=404692 RepID=A0A0J6YB21_COCIT|nr:hypothetical protein CIRG_05617 [Coccidioides immitis RMSCC 2394]